jgi:hypothetical protein
MEETNIIPYGQHYRCFSQMIGSIANQSVFMFLMDEYSYRLKNNQSLAFQISINEIAFERNMSWRTVARSLRELQQMKLITLENSICEVDGNRFISLIMAFNNITDREKRKEFFQLLRKGDYDSLAGFRYKLRTHLKEEVVSSMKEPVVDILSENIKTTKVGPLDLKIEFFIDKSKMEQLVISSIENFAEKYGVSVDMKTNIKTELVASHTEFVNKPIRNVTTNRNYSVNIE